MYAIFLKSKLTDALRNGQPVYDKTTAQSEADRLNREVPELFHWIEEKEV